VSDVVAFSVKRSSGDVFWGVLWSALHNVRIWVSYLMGALIVAGIWFVVHRSGFSEKLAGAGIAFGLMICLYAGLFVLSVGFATLRSRKMAGASDRIAYEISSEGMKVVTETGRGESKWRVWKSWFETKRLIIIRHQIGLVQIVPKRQISDEQLQRIRRVLVANIGRI
jgi:hypothetical protein